MTKVFLILLAAAVAAAGVVFLKFGTIDPCGILRAQIRQEAAREGGVGGAVASALPDIVIDGIIAAQYGALSPGRCIALAFAGAPLQAPTAPRAPPQPPAVMKPPAYQSPAPPNSAAALKQAGDEVTTAVTECTNKRLSGELKTHMDAAKCANSRIVDAFQTAGYRYMDLIYLLTAKILTLAENRDDGQITQAQAQLEFAQFMVRFTDEERQRDRGQR